MWELCSVSRQVLAKQPDCLALNADGDLFISYYGLEDAETQTKRGGMHIVKATGQEAQCECDAGVLDFKLAREGVVACCSDGSLRTFTVDEGRISEADRISVVNSCSTFVDISADRAAVTSSAGELALCDLDTLSVLHRFSISPYESWYTQLKTEGVYASAGTEIFFIPQGEANTQRIRTDHTTEICSFAIDGWTLHSGDFSGLLLTTDLRTGKTVASTQIASSGIWRFAVWQNWTVAACMQDGIVCHCASEALCDKSQSLVYGLCVSPLDTNSISLTSCSFYDRLLATWVLRPLLEHN